MPLDPRRHAVRADLADVRLADRVFAPHYALPVRRTVMRPVELRAAPDAASEVLAGLDAGARFEVLEFAADRAWGIAPDRDLVGYLDADALGVA